MLPESLYDVVTDDLDLEAPVLVHALSGFLDAGGARALAAGHLLAAHESRTVATFDLDALYDYRARRPRLVFDTDHYESIDYPELLLSEVRDERGQGFLLLHGPEPDFGWRAFNAAVIQLVERFGVRRTIGLAAIPWPAPHTRPVGVTAHATNPDDRLLTIRPAISLPEGQVWIGAPAEGFATDVERGRHALRLPAFEIDAQPVTWRQYAEFVEDGGYDREDLWHPEGWRWLRAHWSIAAQMLRWR